MPRYDYHCPANGLTVEATHPMARLIGTWGELCECAEIDPGPTPASSPVHKAVAFPSVSTPGKSAGASGASSCTRASCSGCAGCG